MVAILVGLLLIALGLGLSHRHDGFVRPMPIMLTVTGTTLTINGTGLLALKPVSAAAGLMVLTLSLAATVGYLTTMAMAEGTPKPRRPQVPLEVCRARGKVMGLALLLLALYGLVAFRSGVQSRFGQPYGTLSLTQVRFVQVFDPASISPVAALMSLGPLAAIVNYFSYRNSLARTLGTLVPLAISFSTPSRTASLSALVVVSSFIAVAHTNDVSRLPAVLGRRPRRWYIAGAGLVSGIAVWNFLSVGTGLDKIHDQPTLSQLPPGLENVALYLTGSWSALTAGMAGGAGAPGPETFARVFWVVSKGGELLGGGTSGLAAPSSYVSIPIPYNTYSWVGDLVFSVGLIGAILVATVIGSIFGFGGQLLRRRPRLVPIWMNSVLVAIAANMYTGLRIFGLDTLVSLAAGALCLSVLLQRQPPSAPRSAPAGRRVLRGQEGLRRHRRSSAALQAGAHESNEK